MEEFQSNQSIDVEQLLARLQRTGREAAGGQVPVPKPVTNEPTSAPARIEFDDTADKLTSANVVSTQAASFVEDSDEYEVPASVTMLHATEVAETSKKRSLGRSLVINALAAGGGIAGLTGLAFGVGTILERGTSSDSPQDSAAIPALTQPKFNQPSATESFTQPSKRHTQAAQRVVHHSVAQHHTNSSAKKASSSETSLATSKATPSNVQTAKPEITSNTSIVHKTVKAPTQRVANKPQTKRSQPTPKAKKPVDQRLAGGASTQTLKPNVDPEAVGGVSAPTSGPHSGS